MNEENVGVAKPSKSRQIVNIAPKILNDDKFSTEVKALPLTVLYRISSETDENNIN